MTRPTTTTTAAGVPSALARTRCRGCGARIGRGAFGDRYRAAGKAGLREAEWRARELGLLGVLAVDAATARRWLANADRLTPEARDLAVEAVLFAA
jgi:hypothetical protein